MALFVALVIVAGVGFLLGLILPFWLACLLSLGLGAFVGYAVAEATL